VARPSSRRSTPKSLTAAKVDGEGAEDFSQDDFQGAQERIISELLTSQNEE